MCEVAQEKAFNMEGLFRFFFFKTVSETSFVFSSLERGNSILSKASGLTLMGWGSVHHWEPGELD